jgi:hypothetical protein
MTRDPSFLPFTESTWGTWESGQEAVKETLIFVWIIEAF